MSNIPSSERQTGLATQLDERLQQTVTAGIQFIDLGTRRPWAVPMNLFDGRPNIVHISMCRHHQPEGGEMGVAGLPACPYPQAKTAFAVIELRPLACRFAFTIQHGSKLTYPAQVINFNRQ